MPRGDNPNSRANLKKPSDFTSKELRDRAKKGAKASAEARRQYKTFRESMQELATPEKKAKINSKMLEMAMRGNIRAFEMVLRVLGENSVDEADNDNVRAFLDALKGGKE